MIAEKKVERIRAILGNDGHGWDRSLEMLQEIEEIVTPKPTFIKFSISEELLDQAAVDPKVEEHIRGELYKKLMAEIDTAIKSVRS